MCLILDANKYSDYLDPTKEDMDPVRDWIEKKNGRIAYAPTEKMEQELNNHREMYKQMNRYGRRGKIKIWDKDEVAQKAEELSDLQSDDPDIIALAQVANVKLLVSSDKALGKDFKRKIRKGKVYKKREHRHLLDHNICP